MTEGSRPASIGAPHWAAALTGPRRGPVVAFLLLAAMIGISNAISPGAMSYFEVSFLSGGGAALSLAAVGQTIVVLTGGFDLSAGAVVSLVNVVLASQMQDNLPSILGWSLAGVGIGMAVNQAKAVVEALLDRQSEFTRTPKTGSEGKSVKAVQKAYRGKRSWVPVIELLFGLYFTGAVWFAWTEEIWTSLPFLVLFQSGFLYVGINSMLEFRGKSKSAPQVVAQPQPTS